ncbi:hypothetical protein [Lentibacillus sp. Marseille-P4043]|uniref:hypothetical protein n=1 Tax=Lentibacillus sp. Marseille-P4043 TaxID=2040293 RepID=UPI000D0BD94E|nr:hypothetical protein [Lentibacillus sp. Marseille-P4043]
MIASTNMYKNDWEAFQMGYVLPISQYQYTDYKQRVIKEKQDPFYIESPYKVILDSQHQDIPQEHTQRASTINTSNDHVEKPVHDGAEKVYANITGKGRIFSESI